MSAEGLIRVRILGCGSSGGVPRADGDWGSCNPESPRNRRRRCSILLEKASDFKALERGSSTRILVDTSPDLREQLIDAGSPVPDAIVYTHAHADQAHGIDDIRAIVYRHQARIAAYMNVSTRADLFKRFGYIFETPPGSGYPPLLEPRDLPERDRISIEGEGGAIELETFPVQHGNVVCAGLRFGPVAYTPDVSAIDQAGFDALQDVPLWILDALREKPHPTHTHVGQSLDWLEKVRARYGILTNLHIDLDYDALSDRCAENVEPAFDGMVVTIDAGTGKKFRT